MPDAVLQPAGATPLPREIDQPRRIFHKPQIIVLVEVLLFAILLAMLVRSPSRMVYDERYSVPTITSFHEHGLAPQYLNQSRYASGPLFSAVFSELSSASGNNLHRYRFVNYVLTCVLVALLWLQLIRDRAPFSAPLAGAIIAIPITWVCTGIALDEMLGLVLLALALLPLGRDLFDAETGGWRAAMRFALAGAGIGLAALVRQPFVLASLSLPIAAIVCRRRVAMSMLTPLMSGALLSPVLLVWHGLTPPAMRNHAGFAPEYCLLSLAYGGLFALLIAPGYLRSNWREIGIVALCSVAINLTFRVVVWQPVHTIAAKVVPAAFMHFYALLCGALLVGAGVFFACKVAQHTIASRTKPWAFAVQLGLLLLLIWPVVMKVRYSSRYTLMTLPFLVLAVRDYYRPNTYTTIRTIAGGVIGALVLWTYYVT